MAVNCGKIELVGPQLLANNGIGSLSKSISETSEFLDFDAQWCIKSATEGYSSEQNLTPSVYMQEPGTDKAISSLRLRQEDDCCWYISQVNGTE